MQNINIVANATISSFSFNVVDVVELQELSVAWYGLSESVAIGGGSPKMAHTVCSIPTSNTISSFMPSTEFQCNQFPGSFPMWGLLLR